MKRVLTIQDISCLGKCSLTVALPVISALGSETVILPTTLLSVHTAFPNFTSTDLSAQVEPITESWKKQDIAFDAIYTGYLGSVSLIDRIEQVIRDFRKEDQILLVDPVMGDGGSLYPGFGTDYAERNAALCGMADIILPNITEACLMTGTEYREEYDKAYAYKLLRRTVELGAGITCITGVSLEQGKTGFVGMERKTGEVFLYQNRREAAVLHGTGDLFASACTGELLRGRNWKEAAQRAAEYTAYTIGVTMRNPQRAWYGVDFETTIPQLITGEYSSIPPAAGIEPLGTERTGDR